MRASASRAVWVRAGIGLGLLALATTAGVAAWLAGALRAGPPGRAASLDVLGTVPPFALTERSGRLVTREDLRGLVWVANFIYTDCTETCPLQSRYLAALQAAFADAADLRLVSVTVDPEHDTPAVLQRYAERHRASPRWWFLTGDKAAIYCLARDGFRLSVADPAALAPPECGRAWRFLTPRAAWASHGSHGLFVHSDRLVLVDRAARIRAYHRAADPDSRRRLEADLRRLLAEAPQA